MGGHWTRVEGEGGGGLEEGMRSKWEARGGEGERDQVSTKEARKEDE